MTYMSVINCRAETAGWDFENVRFWGLKLKHRFSGRAEKYIRAFWRAAAQNQVTRRAEIGSFSASARRVISNQDKLSFHWPCPKVENLRTQLDFWRSLLLRLVVSLMFPSQIFVEVYYDWVWAICHYLGVSQRREHEIFKMLDFENRDWRIHFPAAPRAFRRAAA